MDHVTNTDKKLLWFPSLGYCPSQRMWAYGQTEWNPRDTSRFVNDDLDNTVSLKVPSVSLCYIPFYHCVSWSSPHLKKSSVLFPILSQSDIAIRSSPLRNALTSSYPSYSSSASSSPSFSSISSPPPSSSLLFPFLLSILLFFLLSYLPFSLHFFLHTASSRLTFGSVLRVASGNIWGQYVVPRINLWPHCAKK